MSDEYLSSLKDDFEKVVASLKRDLTTIRTGRASPQLLENVQVAVASYGATMPINQLASISAPDARLLVLNPWDKATISDIEKGILASGLGLNPSNDGQVVRVPIPALTGERRNGMVKQIGKHVEEARIRARGVRKEYNDLYKELQDAKEITEDDLKRSLTKVQEATDACVKLLDSLAADKEKEVLEG
jgi:ribosome recycling factor